MSQVWLVQADAVSLPLKDGSVHCCITSPPYWGLRLYNGVAPSIWGGETDCQHVWGELLTHNGTNHTDKRRWQHPRNGRDEEQPREKQVAWLRTAVAQGQSCHRCLAWAGCLGLEPLHDCLAWARGQAPCPQCFICHMRVVFAEVWRCLRDHGVLFVNIGDSYNAAGREGHGTRQGYKQGTTRASATGHDAHRPSTPSLKPKDLCGMPWRLALALQADGWYLRSEIIWCLSGGTWVYARTKKGDMPLMVRDLARLNPSTVQLWNGEKWTQLLGMSRNARQETEIEIVLRSGERISCTPTHQFPTQRGLLRATALHIGDVLQRVTLPAPVSPLNPQHLGPDAAWLAGLYVAEGSRADDTIQIAGHVKEEERWQRVQEIAMAYGGVATRSLNGNKMDIRLYGKLLNAILDQFVTGKTAKDKAIAPIMYRYGNAHLSAWLEGYCGGDGHWDAANQRWRLGFTRNYNLERDLRTVCARLGYHLVLNLASAQVNGQTWPTFRGEIRTHRSGHHNEKDTGTIVALQKARCREVYDLGVADEPHVFALASGILTHNSKPNPMPESVTDRPTKAHEQVFLLSKNERYFWDAEGIREPHTAPPRPPGGFTPEKSGGPQNRHGHSQWDRQRTTEESYHPAGRNARSVWTLSTEPTPFAHFATFPTALAERCMRAGTSAHGVCAQCRAPWVRQVEYGLPSKETTRGRQQWTQVTNQRDSPGGLPLRHSSTTGWAPSCLCNAGIHPATVLDPFAGSGTVGVVARALGRHAVLCDLSWPYLAGVARERLSLAALAAWEGRPIDIPATTVADLPLFGGSHHAASRP